ncbi:MAG: hypothetical protein ACRDKY_07315 [Solirubrobacteraceae bacterium]
MRATTVCLLALALTFCGSPAAVAKKPKKPSACQKLSKRYTDLATSRKLVTVVRGNDETGRIGACVLPRGKVRTLAEWDDPLLRDWASVVDTAGTWVLVDEGHSDQYGGVSRLLTRIEVRGNTRQPLSGYACQLYDQLPHCPDGTNYGKTGIAPSGAGAVERTNYASGVTTLLAFNTAGRFTPLADGAVQALRVTSTQIHWRQGGIGHTVALPD